MHNYDAAVAGHDARTPNGHCAYCGTAYVRGFAVAPDLPRMRRDDVAQSAAGRAFARTRRISTTARGPGVIVVRRDIEPARGELCLPGGFIEYGETWEEGAARELREEAGLHADPDEVSLFDVASTGRHILIFGIVPPRAARRCRESAPTDESTEWVVLREPTVVAFPFHTDAIAKFFAEIRSDGGEFGRSRTARTRRVTGPARPTAGTARTGTASTARATRCPRLRRRSSRGWSPATPDACCTDSPGSNCG